jgi:phosphate transport system protein
MSVHFEQEIHALRQKLLTMASLAAEGVHNAVRALAERDDDLARRVKEDDSAIDRLEVELDEAAIRLLAMAPLAGELRLIIVAMKISHDLERVGDEATAISKRVLELDTEPPLKADLPLAQMATLAVTMLDQSITAFLNRQPDLARVLIPQDREVDALNRKIQADLVSLMTADSSTISRALNLMAVSRRLERIADHATNVAEEVVYLFEARDIRHVGKANAPSAPGKELC